MADPGNGTAPTNNSNTNEAQHQRIRVVVKRRGRFLLLNFQNDAMQSGDQVMRTIRHECSYALVPGRASWLPASLFRRHVVYIGTISILSPPDDRESGNGLREVAISQLEYSAALTLAFSRPDILRDAGPFAQRYPDTIEVDPPNPEQSLMKAVVVVLRINKSIVFFLVGLALLAATAVSLGVGITLSSLEIGLTCFTVVSAALSLIIAVLHWATK
ncbi:hypothetical protein N656DRAFT_776228 [Canariomyces notabilis]|uniref:Uncharacterized protein n=1 Tax=Canariomyces notabilis TaxID=2074819 RepID=A0AAN6TJ97_9PEZI|nr:hypothetical protein N656DRAFT_776228 [Canariomyces arenarius]